MFALPRTLGPLYTVEAPIMAQIHMDAERIRTHDDALRYSRSLATEQERYEITKLCVYLRSRNASLRFDLRTAFQVAASRHAAGVRAPDRA